MNGWQARPFAKSHRDADNRACRGEIFMTSRSLRIDLDTALAERIENEVRAGRFESVDSFISEAATRMIDEDSSAVEEWLKTAVVKGHAEYLEDPSKAVPADLIMQRLREGRGRR
jgi:antitoxin ParD1/3/4